MEQLDEKQLKEFIRRQLPEADSLVLSEAGQAAGGVSRDHFLLDLSWSQGRTRHELPLVVIRDGDRPGQTDRGAEFRLLQALEPTSIPAPKVYWCDMSGEWLGRPFIVMERVGGAITPPMQVPYPDDPALRGKLCGRFVDVLSDLHALDWRALGIDFLETPGCAVEELAETAAKLLRGAVETLDFVKPHPTLDRALAWGVEHAPRTRRWTICHGDYKPDNILHEKGELLAVIDWERARIGDPLADLGYVCAPHLRASNLASGLDEQEEILGRYEQRSGLPVDRDAIRFWQVHLLLQTHLYFCAQIDDAARRGQEAPPMAGPMMSYLLGLIEETLG